MRVNDFDGSFKGLQLPKDVIDKIYRKNAEKWFPGLFGEKRTYDMRQPLKYLIITIILFTTACTGCHENDPVFTEQGDFFKAVETNDLPLGTPREGEWRYEHNEREQTF